MIITTRKHGCINRMFQLLALAWVAVIAGACALPVNNEEINNEETSGRFNIKAELVTFTVGLKFDGNKGSAVARDENSFNKFLKEFRRRGRSTLTVSTTPQSKPEDERAVIVRLMAEGISRNSIVVQKGKAPKTDSFGVMFSFRGYMVDVPKCGIWIEDVMHKRTNQRHANFGCTYNRNIGLMLADPGDLVAPTGTINTDRSRMDEVIRVFREGKAAGTTAPKNEQGKFAAPSQSQ